MPWLILAPIIDFNISKCVIALNGRCRRRHATQNLSALCFITRTRYDLKRPATRRPAWLRRAALRSKSDSFSQRLIAARRVYLQCSQLVHRIELKTPHPRLTKSNYIYTAFELLQRLNFTARQSP